MRHACREALLADDPTLAEARDATASRALMRARYRFDRPVTDALLAADPDLDVFEATALGYVDRLRERLEEDPARATAYSADGFTALHFAAFFGKPEAARSCSRPAPPSRPTRRNDVREPAARTPRRRAARSRCAGCSSPPERT